MLPIELFKALSDLTRLQCILLIQHEQELCVCELMAALELSQPKVSRHLALLREVGLLEAERRGQWIYYRLSPTLETWVLSILTQASPQQNLTELTQRLTSMGDRPERVAQCC
ncbi:MAG: metalloregulator ArsR/SmtB family transcription factor [Oleispira antarctica]|uniref:Probable transcriptional regulator, ArsR family n=1 Tax=Oleispira antarctica RB-8 TaxID=698738 RepID=R4YMP1_OLEAN|nr:metalloregulator ArsR/SmtB family transcription factor [Oleispira antarctica]MBQ0793966.1 metalloregulator ArsR/SmtB family transcription factor [Oleispira antarctica]CCK74353.1 probable transcriptional regulator, ArsR family [Oleispira antarctica RB-8]